MTDDERELLIKCSSIVVSLLRIQFGNNMKEAYIIEESKDSIIKVNESVLDQSAEMLALIAKVKEPGIVLDKSELVAYFRKENAKTIRDQLVKEVEDYDELLEMMLSDFGLSGKDFK